MFPGVIEPQEVAVIEAGLPSLNREMIASEINTPRRIAAFLTTLRFESRFRYNIRQFTCATTYCGRGYIQLTGSGNYDTAGTYLGIDLLTDPDLALDLNWSAKIACWYWIVNRHCNAFADKLQMGKVNGAIGYPRAADGSNDLARCTAFATALAYLTSEPPALVDCNR